MLVLAENELLDDVIAESPALDFPAPEAIGPRASPIGRAIETALAQWSTDRRWRLALRAERELDPRASRVVERYRELVLAARRAGAEVALLIPALAIAPDAPREELRSAELEAPHARGWLLASRAHARSLRALAGSYGIAAIDTRPALEGAGRAAFAELGRLSAAGRERLAQAVAAALAERPDHAGVSRAKERRERAVASPRERRASAPAGPTIVARDRRASEATIVPPRRSWRVPAGAPRPDLFAAQAPAGHRSRAAPSPSQPIDFAGVRRTLQRIRVDLALEQRELPRATLAQRSRFLSTA